MGRHSSPEKWPYYRSVLGWFLPWILIAAVAGTAVWVAVDAVGEGELSSSPGESTPTANPTPTPSPTRKGGGGGGTAGANDVTLITEGITVQVLNATEVEGAEEEMSARLERVGFDVVAVTAAATRYTETHVFWSDADSREAAVRLAARFGWVALPKPDNLSGEVSVHVVVGEDEV